MKKSATKKAKATTPVTPSQWVSVARKEVKSLAAKNKKPGTWLALFVKVVPSLVSKVSSLQKKVTPSA